MKNLNLNSHGLRNSAALFCGVALLSGCVKSTRTSTGTSPKSPWKPTHANSSAILKNGRPVVGSEKAEWIQQVADKPITAKPKDIVLAAIPVNRKSFHFIIGRVDKIAGETATVTEIIHPQYQSVDLPIMDVYSNIPGGMIFPVPKNRKLKEGDWAIGITKDRHLALGRVSPLKGDRYSIRYYDDIPREEKDTYIFPLNGEIAPLQPIAYKKKFAGKTKTRIGFTTLQIGDDFLIASESGSTVAIDANRDLVERTDIAPLPIQAASFQVGETVQAYRWSQGFEEAKIEKVIEPGFEYQIDRPSGRSRSTDIPHFWLQKELPKYNSVNDEKSR